MIAVASGEGDRTRDPKRGLKWSGRTGKKTEDSPPSPEVRADTGGLAQLARALALQARGHRFESDILHTKVDYRMELCGMEEG